MSDAPEQEDARQLLRALAAQVKPVMKAHGFSVNSLEEYEYNNVFAGRNWNNGEVVELVLRRQNGFFQPTSWLMSTLCHELAHIKHMNHGPAFQALWTRLRNEVRALQLKGYYGDGYWSSGTRLADSSKIVGDGVVAGDFPEYMCGGAQARKRPTALRRRRNRASRAGPSHHTGVQIAKKRKAGSRVTASNTFHGEGNALNEEAEPERKNVGTGFRKQAASKRAREERALAAEKRIRTLQGQATPSTSSHKTNETGDDIDSSSDSDIEEIQETDQDRRRTLLGAMKDGDSDLENTKTLRTDFSDDFIFPDAGCDLPTAASPGGSTFATGNASGMGSPLDEGIKGKSKLISNGSDKSATLKQHKTPTSPRSNSKHGLSNEIGLGKIVQSEISLRKKESLGLTGAGRKLGGTSRKSTSDNFMDEAKAEGWSCLVCTLANKREHLACSACGTPRGEAIWAGDSL